MKKIGITVLSIVIGLFVLGLFIGTGSTISDNAIVYVDDVKKVYYAPLAVDSDSIHISRLRTTTYKEACNKDYKPDEKSADQGYFYQEGRSLSGKLLEKIGILPKQKSRWKENGEWRY